MKQSEKAKRRYFQILAAKSGLSVARPRGRGAQPKRVTLKQLNEILHPGGKKPLTQEESQ